ALRGRLRAPSGQQTLYHFAMDIGEAIVAPFESIGQSFVVDAKQVKHGRVEIMHIDRVVHHVIAEVIRCAEHQTRSDTAAGHPDREATRMMVAAEVVLSDLPL